MRRRSCSESHMFLVITALHSRSCVAESGLLKLNSNLIESARIFLSLTIFSQVLPSLLIQVGHVRAEPQQHREGLVLQFQGLLHAQQPQRPHELVLQQ